MKIRRRLAAVAVAMLVGVGLSVTASSPAHADDRIPYGPYRLKVTSTTCLDVVGASQSNGAYLQVYTCLPNQYNQMFYLWATPNVSGFSYQITPAHSWKCLDVEGVSQAAGANIQQYDCLGFNQLNQIFLVNQSPPRPANYYLSAMHSSKCISYPYGWYNGAPVVQSTSPCPLNAEWYIAPW